MKTLAALFLTAALAEVPPPPPSRTVATAETRISPAQVARLLGHSPGEPSLAAVQEAALRRAALDPPGTTRWLRRARLAALLPEVEGGVDHRLDSGYVLDQAGDAAEALKSDRGTSRVLRTRVTWSLDRLVFNPDELRAARASIDLAEARERLLVEVTKLYFARKRLLLERQLVPLADPLQMIAREVELVELEGILGGLTGLRFGVDPSTDPSGIW